MIITNNDFITNFNINDLQKYKLSIAKFKSTVNTNRLYIKDKTYDSVGNLLKNMYALYDTGSGDLSVFWDIFDNINTDTNIFTDTEMLDNMQYYMEYCKKNEYISPIDWIEKHH